MTKPKGWKKWKEPDPKRNENWLMGRFKNHNAINRKPLRFDPHDSEIIALYLKLCNEHWLALAMHYQWHERKKPKGFKSRITAALSAKGQGQKGNPGLGKAVRFFTDRNLDIIERLIELGFTIPFFCKPYLFDFQKDAFVKALNRTRETKKER